MVQNFAVFRGQGGMHEKKMNSEYNVTVGNWHARGRARDRPLQCSRWIEIAMVYLYFQPADSLSDTKGPLSIHSPG